MSETAGRAHVLRRACGPLRVDDAPPPQTTQSLDTGVPSDGRARRGRRTYGGGQGIPLRAFETPEQHDAAAEQEPAEPFTFDVPGRLDGVRQPALFEVTVTARPRRLSFVLGVRRAEPVTPRRYSFVGHTSRRFASLWAFNPALTSCTYPFNRFFPLCFLQIRRPFRIMIVIGPVKSYRLFLMCPVNYFCVPRCSLSLSAYRNLVLLSN